MLFLRDKCKSERNKDYIMCGLWLGAVPHLVGRPTLSSLGASKDITSPFRLSIKRCSEAKEGRLRDVRPWGFTHCTLCLWASTLSECLWDRDEHFHSRHEINSLQPLRVLAMGRAYQSDTGLARNGCKWSSHCTPFCFQDSPPPCQYQPLLPTCFFRLDMQGIATVGYASS